jgi:hypothetical protein
VGDLRDIPVRLAAWRTGAILAGVVAIGAAGVVIANDGAERLGGVFVLAVGVLLGVLLGRRVLQENPVLLTITRRGLEHPWTGLIPWREIDRVEVYRPGGMGKMLGIWVRDPDALQARIARGERSGIAALLTGFRGGRDASLAVPGLLVDRRLRTLRAEMERRAGRRLAG